MIFLILFPTLLVGCKLKQETETYRESRILFDTEVFIEAYGDGAQAAGEKAFEEMDRLDRSLDVFDPTSELSRLNQSAGTTPYPVSDDTFEIIQDALEMARRSDGYFNPAIGPLVTLWQKARDTGSPPGKPEIENALTLLDYRSIQLNAQDDSVYLPTTGMSLDLGGIAKGYAVEKAVAILKDAGIQSAMVAAGGDIYTIGNKPDHSPWRVGIKNPQDPEGVIGTVNLSDQAIDTSGQYERYFSVGDTTYGHILNPFTGYPADEALSCSIITDRPVVADAMATAIFAMGIEKGLRLLEDNADIEGILIDLDGQPHITQGLENQFVITNDPIK